LIRQQNIIGRAKLKRWCKYWHFNVLGVLSDNDGHRNYLDVTSILNDWHDADIWDDFNDVKEMISLETKWKTVLSCINKCSDDQIQSLLERCHTRKDG